MTRDDGVTAMAERGFTAEHLAREMEAYAIEHDTGLRSAETCPSTASRSSWVRSVPETLS